MSSERRRRERSRGTALTALRRQYGDVATLGRAYDGGGASPIVISVRDQYMPWPVVSSCKALKVLTKRSGSFYNVLSTQTTINLAKKSRYTYGRTTMAKKDDIGKLCYEELRH